jgi:putative tryptophan/tyrosine transport system substrate-binding protein
MGGVVVRGIARRTFLTTALGGVAALLIRVPQPRAQAGKFPTIGFVSGSSAEFYEPMMAAFTKSLGETGFAEGQNVRLELRWADGHYEQLPHLVSDLLGRQVDVIVASTSPAAVAAKSATATVPIVFSSGEDPVKAGLVTSFNRPGGNATGIYSLVNGLEEKRLGLLRDLVPQAGLIGAIINPNRTDAQLQSKDVAATASALGLQIRIENVESERDFDAAFAAMARARVGALLIGADPAFIVWNEQIVALAARYRLPAIYPDRVFVVSGGLMSYGIDFVDAYRQAGLYAGRILKGERPADLPVIQLTKFELAINSKTAKALGLALSAGLLSIADEVIE